MPTTHYLSISYKIVGEHEEYPLHIKIFRGATSDECTKKLLEFVLDPDRRIFYFEIVGNSVKDN